MKRLPSLILLMALLLCACNLNTPPTPTGTSEVTNTPPDSQSTPTIVMSKPKMQVFILSPLTTCLVGNEFASGNVCAGSACGDCSCSWEEHDPPAPHTGIPPAQIDGPQFAGYASRICLDLTLSDEEVQEIIADMEEVRQQAYEWTGGALDLQIETRVLAHEFTGFTAPDFVIGPFEIDDELLNQYVSTDTDMVYVISGVHDRAQGLHLSYWCGGYYGEMSIHGAGYSYIQYNEACNSVQIDGETVYEPLIHEWIHNLDWTLYYVNGVPDVLQDKNVDWANWEHATWPACGEGPVKPLDWFPSIDFCEWDPDWMDCNNTASAGACLHAGEVNGDISWYEHVLATHYPRDIQYIGNFCRDGRQDFGETGVDSGGACP